MCSVISPVASQKLSRPALSPQYRQGGPLTLGMEAPSSSQASVCRGTCRAGQTYNGCLGESLGSTPFPPLRPARISGGFWCVSPPHRVSSWKARAPPRRRLLFSGRGAAAPTSDAASRPTRSSPAPAPVRGEASGGVAECLCGGQFFPSKYKVACA